MIRRLAAALVPLIFVLAACSGGGGDEADDGTDDVATLEGSDDDANADSKADTVDADDAASDDADSDGAGAGESAAELTTTTAAPTTSSSSTTTTAPAQDDQDILNDFSGCMRGEGLDDFPDLALGIGGIQEIIEAGIDPLSREFTSALGSCAAILEPIQQAPTELSPEERLTAEQALLAGSVCMRGKGYPNFPDPDFTAGLDQRAYAGGVIAAGINLLEPEFQQAAAECQEEIAEEFDLQLNGN